MSSSFSVYRLSGRFGWGWAVRIHSRDLAGSKVVEVGVALSHRGAVRRARRAQLRWRHPSRA